MTRNALSVLERLQLEWKESTELGKHLNNMRHLLERIPKAPDMLKGEAVTADLFHLKRECIAVVNVLSWNAEKRQDFRNRINRGGALQIKAWIGKDNAPEVCTVNGAGDQLVLLKRETGEELAVPYSRCDPTSWRA